MPQSPRFQSLNARLLRSLRRRVGWSQSELGKRAGYSERVIRKAEAGGKLNLETIENIAQTLSTVSIPITGRELIFSEELLARKFVESYDAFGIKMLEECGDFLDENFFFHVPAPGAILQWAGTYVGLPEFQHFLNRFFSVFTRCPASLHVHYLSSSGRVIASFEDTLSANEKLLPGIWVNLHFYFNEGLISRVDQQFDYLTALAAMDAVQLKKGFWTRFDHT
jgi:transcriptional regulator with XRE-family HTH domain